MKSLLLHMCYLCINKVYIQFFYLVATDVFAKGFYVVRELPYVESHTKVNSAHILPTNCSFILIFFNNKCIQLLY